ncbi:hypothetical protein N7451_004888 [Penicillium sp. IBT 35674x]|nr:hypothetical protein N7451_004888 [Penicillium sp. IBT 35674x]
MNVAYMIGDAETATSWKDIWSNIGKAINQLLWSEGLGACCLSSQQPNNVAIQATAFTTCAGIASTERMTSNISRPPDAFLPMGYKEQFRDGQ